jgi:hypothetical protein
VIILHNLQKQQGTSVASAIVTKAADLEMKGEESKSAETQEAIEVRQAYLRKQRDKLVAMKQEARQRAFMSNTDSQTGVGKCKHCTSGSYFSRGHVLRLLQGTHYAVNHRTVDE